MGRGLGRVRKESNREGDRLKVEGAGGGGGELSKICQN